MAIEHMGESSAERIYMANNLFIKLIAMLNRALSRKQISRDVVDLEKTPFYVRLTGKLNKSKTIAKITKDLKNIGSNQTIKINAEIDKKNLHKSLDETISDIQSKANEKHIEIPVDVETKSNVSSQIAEQEKNTKSLLKSYFSWYQVLSTVKRAISEMFNAVSELNEKQTDLQIVTGKTDSEIKSLMGSYNQLAKELSVTTIDIADSADEWLRQGKSLSETEELITDSTILSKVGKIDSADATKYLTSAMNGFHKEASDVIGIVDKLTSVDLESATSAGGLAEAMSKCANSANIAGVSMDSLIGYIAAVSEVTQKSDSVVGESFKSILARMGKIKLNKWIDEDGNDISGEINDVEKTLAKCDIQLRKSATEFRNFEDVIYDVGTSWDKFTSVDKNAIANAFGGVYQRENVLTLFDNFNRALELTEVSANSTGTAIQKFEVYENSLEAATNRLTAAFESLSYNSIDSDFAKGIITSTADIVEFIDKAKLLDVGLRAITFTGIIKGLLLFGSKLTIVKNNVVNISSAMNILKQSEKISEQQLNDLARAYTVCSASQRKMILSSKSLTDEQRKQILKMSGVKEAEIEATLASMGLTAANNSAATATFSLRGAFEALKLSIASNPIGIIVTALTLATSAISLFNQNQKELSDSIKETGDEAKSSSDNITSLYSDYIELNEAVANGTGSKEELTTATDELLKALGLEGIAVSELTKEYGSLENAISNVSIESLKNAHDDLVSSVATYEQELLDVGKSGFGLKNTLFFDNYFNDAHDKFGMSADEYAKEYEKIVNTLEEIQGVTSKKFEDEYGVWYNFNLTGDESTIDGIKQNYETLIEMRDNLVSKLGSERAGQLDIYQNINTRLNELKTAYIGYDNEVAALNQNAAKTAVLESLKGNELPKTQEEYENFLNSLIEEATKAGTSLRNQFIGSNEDIENSITAAMENMSVFSQFVESTAGNISDSTNKNTVDVTKMVEAVSDKVKVLKQAMSDMAESNYISADTYSDIIKLGGNFADCLEIQNNKLTLNIDKLKELETQEYRNAISANNLAIAQMQLHINGGYDYQVYSERINALKEENALIEGIIDEINSASPDTKKSSSTKISIPEAYTKAKKELEHIYNMGEISTKEYYIRLNKLAEQWLKGNENYLDEYRSVQESVYSGLKSLYSDEVNTQIEGYENVLDVLKNINQEKIDGLNKEKEALQDNADEEQRILDLKQAQLDLENAKKKTNWVITEQGLKQVQDTKAVDEAQQALDKLELESKTAQIDKKIELLENENDKYDKIKTDWQTKVNLENAKKFIGSDNIKNAVTDGFKEGYQSALSEKENLDNLDKNGYSNDNTYNLDKFLKHLGSPYSFEQVKDIFKKSDYMATFSSSYADKIKAMTNNVVNNTANTNNNSTIGDINIVINDATDPEKVGNIVVKKIKHIAEMWNNKPKNII